MANQAIALQARAPQGNFLAPAIQQGAQMINMMRQQQALDRQTAAQEQQLKLQMAQEGRAAAGEARAAELHPFAVSKAQADAMTAEQKAAIGFYDLTIEGLKRSTSPQQAMAVANYLKEQFPGAASAVDQTISTLPSDPNKFEPWRKQTLFQSMTSQQQLAKKFIAQNTSTGTRQLEVSEFEPGAAAQELPGSRSELGQEVTYITLADGRRVAMPKRLPAGGGGGIVGGVRGGGATGGVQVGQPIAGTGKPPKPKPGEISPEKKLARDTAVQDLYNAIEEAQKKGHLVSEKQSFIANRAQELRQGRAYLPGGTEQKTSVEDIDAAARQLLRLFIEKGTSGTLNTKAEQDMFLSSVGGANSTYETRLKTIRNFAKQNGIKLNETAAAGATSAAPIGPPPPGVPAAEWKAMSPEDRKLWSQ
jgi:hypothetical protein